jgi:hypothetical protein
LTAMPPKKGKKKKDEVVEEEEKTEYDEMDLSMLQEVVPMLNEQLRKQKLDRNYVQLERDTIQTFADITHKECTDLDRKVELKDKDMEKMEENHRVEVRVYLQKVKHLEFEHRNDLTNIWAEGDMLLEEEVEDHDGKESGLKTDKTQLKMELQEGELVNCEETDEKMIADSRNLEVMRKVFEKHHKELEDRLKNRLAELEADLELRRKVHIHEIEERKNLHINDLMRNHDRAFGQMKSYYNDITKDNLQLICSLKDQVSEMKMKAVANQKLMYDISNENQRLKEPLTVAVQEVAELRAQLKDRDKDKLSLRNGKARLRVFEHKLQDLRTEHEDLLRTFKDVESDRDSTFQNFDDDIKGIQESTEMSNTVVSQRLQTAMDEEIEATAQVAQITAAAKLDSHEIRDVERSISEALATRNSMSEDLQYQLLRAQKGFNDSLNTFRRSMAEFGVPDEEVDSMGFIPFPQSGASTNTGPAGLVVA